MDGIAPMKQAYLAARRLKQYRNEDLALLDIGEDASEEAKEDYAMMAMVRILSACGEYLVGISGLVKASPSGLIQPDEYQALLDSAVPVIEHAGVLIDMMDALPMFKDMLEDWIREEEGE